MNLPGRRLVLFASFVPVCTLWSPEVAQSQNETGSDAIEKVAPGQFMAITEPPCSYCSTQHRKELISSNDRVLAWLRGVHNGGAIPLRHFLAGPRVINDTYGLFFYDPDGGYVSAFRKDYGYEVYGWRRGVMVVRSKDGTLWSALTGKAFEGPQKGKSLKRIASMATTWQHWDVTEQQIDQQLAGAAEAGGYIVAYTAIEQNWEPRLLRVN